MRTRWDKVGTIPITSAMMMVMMMSILVPFKGKKQLDLHTQTCDVETEAQDGRDAFTSQDLLAAAISQE